MVGRSALLQLVPALALQPKLEPYKKLLGVLVRQNCISLALSNPYLNLAEPLGAVMLREGRLPGRAFQRLLSAEQQQLAGFVLAFEVPENDQHAQQPQQQQQQQQQHSQLQQQLLNAAAITQQQEGAAAQVQAALESMHPGLLGGWYGAWSAAAAGTSCRILPPAGPTAAAAAAPDVVSQQQQPSQQPSQQQQQPLCSLGQQFLQSYLDSLGSLNTFG